MRCNLVEKKEKEFSTAELFRDRLRYMKPAWVLPTLPKLVYVRSDHRA
jgi:hypothetical protein